MHVRILWHALGLALMCATTILRNPARPKLAKAEFAHGDGAYLDKDVRGGVAASSLWLVGLLSGLAVRCGGLACGSSVQGNLALAVRSFVWLLDVDVACSLELTCR